jgi:AcrR family transcriptional regulator
MSRWDPDAQGRLRTAAMELFSERGYDDVTVAEIAERAGLKKRSFFRHYTDKREVLFTGSVDFQRAVVDEVRRAPESARPVEAVTTALAIGGAALVKWGEPVRQRQQLIASSLELRERELIKMDALTTAVADALRTRGVDDVSATLTARAGIAAFTTAFDRWAGQSEQEDFPTLMDDAIERLRVALCGCDTDS